MRVKLDRARLITAKLLHKLSIWICPPERDFDIREGENLYDYFQRKVREEKAEIARNDK